MLLATSDLADQLSCPQGLLQCQSLFSVGQVLVCLLFLMILFLMILYLLLATF